MSIHQRVIDHINQLPNGEPFTNRSFQELGDRAAINKSLSRLVRQGTIVRVFRGVYVYPKKNRFVGNVRPEVRKVIEAITKITGEIFQVHGAEALRRFKLSTQMPTQPIYYTSGSTRIIKVGNLKVKLIHASPRKLQLADRKAGLALTALWFLGKEGLTASHIDTICENLSSSELKELLAADKPAWLNSLLIRHVIEERDN